MEYQTGLWNIDSLGYDKDEDFNFGTFSPVDARAAKVAFEIKGQMASREDLYGLCNYLLDTYLLSLKEGLSDNTVYHILDWAESLPDNIILKPAGKAVSMGPKIIKNPEFEWFQKNYKYLKNNFSNKWIAISDQDVVSYGDSFVTVLNDAKKRGYKRPFMTRVSREWELK